MMRRWLCATFGGLATLCAGPALSQTLDTSVELTYSYTMFTEDTDTLSDGFNSLSGTFTFGGDLSDRWSTNLSLFGRATRRSSSDSILELNEAWLRYATDQFALTTGVDVVSWPTLEFFQNTDIINQRDLSSIERDQRKIGQPMIRGEYYAGDVLIEGYVLPYFTMPIFPGPKSRFGNPLPVLKAGAFDDEDNRKRPSFATRVEYAGLDATIGAFAYHGYQTSPALLTVQTASGLALQQTFSTGTSVGLYGNMLWDSANMILKSHVVRSNNFLNRAGVKQNYTSWGFGIEKSIPTFLFDGTSATFFAEYANDTRDALSTDPYHNAIALGLSIDFHDPSSTKLGLSLTQDVDGSDRIWRIEFDRRLTDNTTMNVQAQIFDAINSTGVLADLNGDSHVQIGFTSRF